MAVEEDEKKRIEELLRGAAEAGGGYDPASLLHELSRLEQADARAALERVARLDMAIPLMLKLAAAGDGWPSALAAEVLGTVRTAAAASALQTLVAGPVGDGVRKAARRALHRLASQGIRPSPAAPAAGEGSRAAGAREDCLASPFDASGDRVVMFGFSRHGETEIARMILNEESGIIDMFTAESDEDRFRREMSRLLTEKELPWVEIPADYGRHLVMEAHSRNSSTGTPLPVDFLAWKDRVARPQREYPLPLIFTVVNAAEVRWDPRYLDWSPQLLDLGEFMAWRLDASRLESLGMEWARRQRTGLVLEEVGPEGDTEHAVKWIVERYFDAKTRVFFKRRLEETAYMLWRRDRTLHAKMALAAALAMEPPDRRLDDHPFLVELVLYNLKILSVLMEEQQQKEIRPGVRLILPR